MTSHRQPDGAPPGWQEAFLAQLRETGNVSAAARAAGTCRSRCYEWRQRDRTFAAAWADALEEAADRLEMEAFRRAVTGVGEDRFGDALSDASLARRHALVSMAFNLGGPRLAGFTRLRAAVRRGDWQAAAAEALDSRWATQTGHRATEIAAMLRGTSG